MDLDQNQSARANAPCLPACGVRGGAYTAGRVISMDERVEAELINAAAHEVVEAGLLNDKRFAALPFRSARRPLRPEKAHVGRSL